MAISLKHATLSTAGPYTPTGELGPTEWNDEHAITMATARLLGRTSASTGAVEELTVGTGLVLASGELKGGAGQWVEVSRSTASNSASIDFTGILDSTSDEWRIEAYNVTAVTGDDSVIYLRTSSNSGSSYDSGASDYASSAELVEYGDTSPEVSTVSLIASQIWIGYRNIQPATFAGSGARVTVTISKPAASKHTMIRYQTDAYIDAGTDFVSTVRGTAMRISTSAVNAVRILLSAENIDTGTFVLLKRLK